MAAFCLGTGVGFCLGVLLCASLARRQEKIVAQRLARQVDEMLRNVRVIRPRGVREERPN